MSFSRLVQYSPIPPMVVSSPPMDSKKCTLFWARGAIRVIQDPQIFSKMKIIFLTPWIKTLGKTWKKFSKVKMGFIKVGAWKFSQKKNWFIRVRNTNKCHGKNSSLGHNQWIEVVSPKYGRLKEFSSIHDARRVIEKGLLTISWWQEHNPQHQSSYLIWHP